MLCPDCGRQVPNNSYTCPHCGCVLTSAPRETMPVPYSPPGPPANGYGYPPPPAPYPQPYAPAPYGGWQQGQAPYASPEYPPYAPPPQDPYGRGQYPPPPGYYPPYPRRRVPEGPKEEFHTYPSDYTAGAFANFFVGLLCLLVSIITVGIFYPAMTCWKTRWQYKHTFIHGRKLTFDGKGIQLFGKWLLWILLTVVTVGIYGVFVLPVAQEKWFAKHTHFADTKEIKEDASYFDGGVFELFGLHLITGLVTIITLGFGYYWAHCYTERWYQEHTVVDGCRLFFDGKGLEFFGKCICWILLTIITLGIFSFWQAVKMQKWTVQHIHTNDFAKLPRMRNAAAERAGREVTETGYVVEDRRGRSR